MDVGAVKHVSGAARIKDAIRPYPKRRKCPNNTLFIVPDQTSLAKRHPADPTAAALEIIEHSGRLILHLLTQALGHERDVDEGEEFVSVRPESPTVERGENSGFPALLCVMNRGIRLMAVKVKRAAA